MKPASFEKEKYFFASAPAFIWQILFFFVPLLFVLILSFIDNSSVKPLFTIQNYLNVLSISQLKAIFASLAIAFVTVIICLLVAYPMAYCLAFKVKKRQSALLFFLMLPLWVNFLVQVYAWFFILEYNGLINSILMQFGFISKPLHLINNLFAIILVMFHVYLPFMVMPIYNVLEKLDPNLLEASRDLGANWITTLKTVTIPLSMSGIQLGSFLVFVMAFGEFIIPSLLGGEKVLFVGPLISQYFLGSSSISLGAAFTILSSLSLVVTLGLMLVVTNRCQGKR